MKQLALLSFILVLSLWAGWPTRPSRYAGPPAYFAFSSQPLLTDRVTELARHYRGNVLIGVDANSEAENVVLAARRGGARLHVYLEGPGGPTGATWTRDELERIELAARQVGLSGADWQKRWDEGGWEVSTFQQLRHYHDLGFESAEVDNLDRVLGTELVPFYQDYAGWYQQGLVPRVVLKNVGPETYARLKAANLPREMFEDYAIWESSCGDAQESSRASAELGIQTLVSPDTYHYAVSGAYELRK